MKTLWTQGVPLDKKKDHEATILNSVIALGRLKKIVKDKLHSLQCEELRSTDLDHPNWALKQSHRNGRKTSLREILDLLDFVKD